MNVTYYFRVLLGKSVRAVHNQKTDVGAAHRVEGAHYRVILYVVLYLAFFSDTRGIDYRIISAVVGKFGIYRVAGSARNVCNNRAFEAQKFVYKAAFARVGLADDRDFNAVVLGYVRLFEPADRFVEDVAYARAVLGGNGVRLAQTQRIEFENLFLGVIVNFIDDENYGFFRAAEHVRNVVIGRGEPLSAVDEKQNYLRGFNRYFCLFFDFPPHSVLGAHFYAPRVHHRKSFSAPFRISVKSVAGHARSVLCY